MKIVATLQQNVRFPQSLAVEQLMSVVILAEWKAF